MVQIITDSSTLHTPEEAKALGFDSLPLCVNIGDLEGRDQQINMEDFYERIRKGQIPRSSQPPIGEVTELFESYPNSDIINITIADGLSGTYQSACGARNLVENADRITIFNCRTLCGPQRYMVEKAQQMKLHGHTAAEILDWLKEAAKKTESFLIPQDFDFLRRGGRLTSVAATLGSVLKLKPIMTLTADGTRLDNFAVKRTMASAVQTIMDHLKKKGLDHRHILYISHADALKDALNIKALFEKAFSNLEIHLLDLGAAFVTQGGPKCVAIQYIEK